MISLSIVTEVTQSLKFLYQSFGLSGVSMCILLVLVVVDMKFNSAAASKYLINLLLRVFKQGVIQLRTSNLKEHNIFPKIDRYLVKLRVYSTTSDYHRNLAKSAILTIKWTIIKNEFTKLVAAGAKKQDFRQRVMKSFEQILHKYEENLREHLPANLVNAYLSKANIRHPEMFMVIENFLNDEALDDNRNLSNIFSYVSSYMLLDSADSDKIFEEMNGSLSEHNIFLEGLDFDKLISRIS